MCGSPESSDTYSLYSEGEAGCVNGKKSGLGVPEAAVCSSDLLELAASNDLKGFQGCVEDEGKKVDEVGTWYAREVGRRQMVLEQRTPLMIAALFGSLDVVKYIVGVYDTVGGDINQKCGKDCCTALHCAAASGSVCAAEVVRVLLNSGANSDSLDAYGRRPADVINLSDRLGNAKATMEELLNQKRSSVSHVDFSDLLDDCFLPSSFVDMGVVAAAENGESDSSGSSSTLSISPRESYASSSSSLLSSPKSPHCFVTKSFSDGNEKVKEYPVDPSLPDIKSSIFATDEFRMYSFKIRPCSRAYSHDWTECPFAHPGENARRRDPRRYHYSCVPCPDFRKGVCQQGDSCEYAHGIFECWLHPAQYRTQLCKDGTSCSRRVCFFAHTAEELRPLYLSTGSAMPSPKSTTFSDMSPVGSPVTPGTTLMRPPFSPTYAVKNTVHGSIMTPPMSPSSAANPWPLSSVPTLHIPGGSLSATRLKATLKAHDFSTGDLLLSPDVDRRLNEYQSFSGSSLSTQARVNAAVAASRNGSFPGRFQNLEHTVAPTNLEELFAMESIVSPRSEMQEPLLLPNSHLATKFATQTNLQTEAKLSREARVQPQAHIHNKQLLEKRHLNGACLQSPRNSTLGFFSQVPSCKGVNIEMHGLNDVPLIPLVEKQSPGDRVSLLQSDWYLQRGKLDWAAGDDNHVRLMKPASTSSRDTEEPDFSWIQKLVKEDPFDNALNAGNNDVLMEGTDVSSWIDKLCLDEVSAN